MESDAGEGWPAWLYGCALVVLTVLVYLPSTRCGYIWDDDLWVTNNVLLRSGDGLGRIWTDLESVPEFYPLTLSSFWIDYQMWKLKAAGYHVENVLLHGVVAVLLWRVLKRLDVPGAWLAAAVVAVHPVNVESVTWVTERKNVLSGALYLASVLAFLRLSDGESARFRWRWLIAALLFYALAVLAKTVTVTLPGVLLILLWWKNGRVRWRDVMETAPFFAIGLPLGLLAIWMQKHHTGATGVKFDLSWGQRMIVAGKALWFYLGKIVWPARLTFIYPRWETDARLWWQYVPGVLAAVVIAALWMVRKRIGRGAVAAVMVFAVTLFPTLGFFDIYWQIYSFVADHVQYIAMMAMVALLAAGLHRALVEAGGRRAVIGVSALLIVVLSVLTWRQQAAYANAEALWRDTLAKNDRAWMAWNNVGSLLAEQEKWDEAMDCYHRALAIDPNIAGAHLNIGIAYEAQGRVEDAMACYRKALEIWPDYSAAKVNLASIYGQRREYALAESLSREVLAKNPRVTGATSNLATALGGQGRRDQAIEVLRAALTKDPWATTVRLNLAAQLTMAGETGEGLAQCREALKRDPESRQAKQLLEVLETRAKQGIR
jgi:tetratricopeptide (TPR) repeat protein